MIGHTLGARLYSVAELVRQGAVFADVGTDHAHLPIFLLNEGIITRAVCSDINKGPLESARRNAEEAGLTDKMEFILTDGAAALSGKGITDYAICGMGGELIAEIIEAAEHLKSKDVALILQPMTKQATLRKYLFKNGFSIVTESYSSEGDRHYVTMFVRFVGKSRVLTEAEAEIGTKPIDFANKTSQIAYLNGKIAACKKIIDGKILGGGYASCEQALLSEIEKTVAELRDMIK